MLLPCQVRMRLNMAVQQSQAERLFFNALILWTIFLCWIFSVLPSTVCFKRTPLSTSPVLCDGHRTHASLKFRNSEVVKAIVRTVSSCLIHLTLATFCVLCSCCLVNWRKFDLCRRWKVINLFIPKRMLDCYYIALCFGKFQLRHLSFSDMCRKRARFPIIHLNMKRGDNFLWQVTKAIG